MALFLIVVSCMMTPLTSMTVQGGAWKKQTKVCVRVKCMQSSLDLTRCV